MKKKKNKRTTVLLVVLLLAGLSLLLYPTVSDYWNSFHQSRAIATYAESVAQIDNSHYLELLDHAHAYNEELARQEAAHWMLTEEELSRYASILDVSGTGILLSLIHI